MAGKKRFFKSKNKTSNKKGKFGKSTFRKKKSNVKNRRIVSSGLGFPKKMLMTHKYVSTIPLSSPVGALINYNFTANGMYDPDLTGGGHQPMYFDQMSALYNHYVVIGSKIRVTVPSSDNDYMIGVYNNDDTALVVSSWTALNEQSLATSKMVPTKATYPTIVQNKWSAKKYFGGSIMSNTDLQGTPTSNPTEATIYNVFMQSVSQVSTVSAFYAKVEIEYIAIWKELKDVSQS